MKTFYKSLRDHAMKIIDFKKKKEVINKRTEEIIWNSKICYICKEKLKDKYINDKNIVKLGTIANIQENIETLHIEYVT